METGITASIAAEDTTDGWALDRAGAQAILAVHGVVGAVGAVEAQPDRASFQFRATHRWDPGTAGRARPAPAGGAGATPAASGLDLLPHAIAACITAGIASIAASRGGGRSGGESTIEGDIDLRGVISVRAG